MTYHEHAHEHAHDHAHDENENEAKHAKHAKQVLSESAYCIVPTSKKH